MPPQCPHEFFIKGHKSIKKASSNTMEETWQMLGDLLCLPSNQQHFGSDLLCL